jgi:hypothetical protein
LSILGNQLKNVDNFVIALHDSQKQCVFLMNFFNQMIDNPIEVDKVLSVWHARLKMTQLLLVDMKQIFCKDCLENSIERFHASSTFLKKETMPERVNPIDNV